MYRKKVSASPDAMNIELYAAGNWIFVYDDMHNHGYDSVYLDRYKVK